MPSVVNQVTIDLSLTIQDQHRDRLEQMQFALDSLIELCKQPISSFTCPQLETLVKQIVQDACTVPDSFFLSDACEGVHELFADFRILLGYFEMEKTHGERFETCLQDVVDDCAKLVRLYRNFLRDPGYVGTAFPKPDKIKAMRRMSRVMSVSVEMESKHSLMQQHTVISMPEQKRSKSLDSKTILTAIKTPATPLLKPQNLATSALLEAVKQVMPTPPPVPARPHPVEVAQKPVIEAPKSALEAINRNLLQTKLGPPTFVDEEGDELPHTPPPQVSPVLSDSDSFMTAFREYAKKQKERRQNAF